jgi:hypothetical protein
MYKGLTVFVLLLAGCETMPQFQSAEQRQAEERRAPPAATQTPPPVATPNSPTLSTWSGA